MWYNHSRGEKNAEMACKIKPSGEKEDKKDTALKKRGQWKKRSGRKYF